MRLARHRIEWIVIIALAGLASAPAPAQTVRYVDDDASLGGDGLGWATAYRYLQDALADAAASGGAVTEIRGAQGVYTPDLDELGNVTPLDREATFQLLNGVAVEGGYAGPGTPNPDERDIDAYQSTLSGDLAGNDGPNFTNYDENSFHVLTGSGTDTTAVLDGFTIRAGHANGPVWPALGTGGAGMLNNAGSPTVHNCTFVANWAQGFGGGMSNMFGASPIVEDCLFDGNLAAPGDGWTTGAAMENYVDVGAIVRRCVFTNNVCAAAPELSEGGAININDSEMTVSECVFTDNSAVDVGGAIEIVAGSLTTI
ncbi:MAG: right-handed parallel beta-helix repeat-containing protein, partial [Planctomycetota bacterium]